MLINMIVKHLPEQGSLSLFLVKKRIWGEGPEEFPAFPIPDAGNSFPSLGAPENKYRLPLQAGVNRWACVLNKRFTRATFWFQKGKKTLLLLF